MKIEKINDNQIKFTLTKNDLDSRGINISELSYGSSKAQELFHEISKQASDKYGIVLDNHPLMIEAIPLPNDSIILLITKVDDPEELDSRFSRFSPSEEDLEDAAELNNAVEHHSINNANEILNIMNNLQKAFKDSRDSQSFTLSKLNSNNLHDNLHNDSLDDSHNNLHDNSQNNLQNNLQNDLQNNSQNNLQNNLQNNSCVNSHNDLHDNSLDNSSNASCDTSPDNSCTNQNHTENSSIKGSLNNTNSADKPNTSSNLTMVYEFNSIDNIIDLSKILTCKYDGVNSLYFDKINNKFYLIIEQSGQSPAEFNQVCNNICEYGDHSHLRVNGYPYFDEHFELIIKSIALQQLAKI